MRQRQWEQSDKDTITISLSHGLKEALYSYCAKTKQTSTAGFIRKVMADAINYSLQDEPKPTRKTKYSSKEERLAEQKRRAKEKSALIRKLLEAERHQAQLDKRKAIQDSINK